MRLIVVLGIAALRCDDIDPQEHIAATARGYADHAVANRVPRRGDHGNTGSNFASVLNSLHFTCISIWLEGGAAYLAEALPERFLIRHLDVALNPPCVLVRIDVDGGIRERHFLVKCK